MAVVLQDKGVDDEDFRRLLPRLTRFAVNRGMCQQDAEAAASWALFMAFRKRQEAANPGFPVARFASSVIVNGVIDEHRKTKNHSFITIDLSDDPAFAVDQAHEGAENVEHCTALQEALDSLHLTAEQLELLKTKGGDEKTRTSRSRLKRFVATKIEEVNRKFAGLALAPLYKLAERAQRTYWTVRTNVEQLPAAGQAAMAAALIMAAGPVVAATTSWNPDTTPNTKAPMLGQARLASDVTSNVDAETSGRHHVSPAVHGDAEATPTKHVEPKNHTTVGGYTCDGSTCGKASPEDLDKLRTSLLYVGLLRIGDVDGDGRADPLFEFGTNPPNMRDEVHVDVLTGSGKKPVTVRRGVGTSTEPDDSEQQPLVSRKK